MQLSIIPPMIQKLRQNLLLMAVALLLTSINVGASHVHTDGIDTDCTVCVLGSDPCGDLSPAVSTSPQPKSNLALPAGPSPLTDLTLFAPQARAPPIS